MCAHEFKFQLMVSGDPGGLLVSAPRHVEEDLSISPGAVTLLLQQMGGNIARGNILGTVPATTNSVS